MDIKDEFYLKRYEAYQKEIAYLRKTELMLLNYSMIIFGAVMYFIFNIVKDDWIIMVVSSVFLAVIIALISLFVARYRELEELNNIYIKKHQNDINDKYKLPIKQYKYTKRKYFARTLEAIAFQVLIVSALACAVYLLWINTSARGLKSGLIISILIYIIYFFYYFYPVMFVKIVDIKNNIKPIKRNI